MLCSKESPFAVFYTHAPQFQADKRIVKYANVQHSATNHTEFGWLRLNEQRKVTYNPPWFSRFYSKTLINFHHDKTWPKFGLRPLRYGSLSYKISHAFTTGIYSNKTIEMFQLLAYFYAGKTHQYYLLQSYFPNTGTVLEVSIFGAEMSLVCIFH